MTAFLLALLAVQALAPPAPPPAETGQDPVEQCADMVRSDPAHAVDFASAWRLQGGGIQARQCLGLAYVAQERWESAATVYEQAAQDAAAAGDPRVGDFWAQAGNAWLAAGEATRAVQALDSALAAPAITGELRGEVHVDRARALVALDNAPGAREDLDRALALVPGDPFAWYLSAALARRNGDLVRARTDIARARELAPANPDFTLLAGTIAGLAGDMEEAERLYRQVAEQAPDSEAGRAARASLATVREVGDPATPVSSPAESPAAPPEDQPPSPAPPPRPQSR